MNKWEQPGIPGGPHLQLIDTSQDKVTRAQDSRSSNGDFMREAAESTTDGRLGHAHASPEMRQIDELLPSVYEELRDLAKTVLQRCQTIDSTHTTSLIHDAYVRLADRGMRFHDRSHFLCVAARAMRFVLVDRARREGALKRGGGLAKPQFEETVNSAIGASRLLAVNEALVRLASFDERKSRVVELRFFGGLSVEEVSEVTGLSLATVKREWSLARAWLYREIGDA